MSWEKIAICIISIIFGIILCKVLYRTSDEVIHDSKNTIEQYDGFEQQHRDKAYKTFIKIFTNNMVVGILLAFGGFFTGGFLTCIILSANAFFVTSVIFKCVEINLSAIEILSLFSYHGLFEVSAFIWFGVIGLKGYSFVKAIYKNGIIIKNKIPKLKTLVPPSIILLIAAIIETIIGYTTIL